mmetsp:Transcript_81058/g.185592  ORF Transcript_81058/g.185592 Transcript_81058/m.185592 type:complete len:606 (+) Transcript_81058:66-1883(+)
MDKGVGCETMTRPDCPVLDVCPGETVRHQRDDHHAMTSLRKGAGPDTQYVDRFNVVVDINELCSVVDVCGTWARVVAKRGSGWLKVVYLHRETETQLCDEDTNVAVKALHPPGAEGGCEKELAAGCTGLRGAAEVLSDKWSSCVWGDSCTAQSLLGLDAEKEPRPLRPLTLLEQEMAASCCWGVSSLQQQLHEASFPHTDGLCPTSPLESNKTGKHTRERAHRQDQQERSRSRGWGCRTRRPDVRRDAQVARRTRESRSSRRRHASDVHRESRARSRPWRSQRQGRADRCRSPRRGDRRGWQRETARSPSGGSHGRRRSPFAKEDPRFVSRDRAGRSIASGGSQKLRLGARRGESPPQSIRGASLQCASGQAETRSPGRPHVEASDGSERPAALNRSTSDRAPDSAHTGFGPERCAGQRRLPGLGHDHRGDVTHAPGRSHGIFASDTAPAGKTLRRVPKRHPPAISKLQRNRGPETLVQLFVPTPAGGGEKEVYHQIPSRGMTVLQLRDAVRAEHFPHVHASDLEICFRGNSVALPLRHVFVRAPSIAPGQCAAEVDVRLRVPDMPPVSAVEVLEEISFDEQERRKFEAAKQRGDFLVLESDDGG